ncbi:MAG: hypothetical protein OSJ70_03650 [Bacilli bacterium]|nr:hypothetical protein [Bacilli bacterium]
MKNNMKGIIQLALSILIFILFHFFCWKVLGLFGFYPEGMIYEIMNFIKYTLITVIVFVIYYGNIKHGQSRFNKTLLNNIIYSVACFVFLIIITIILHEVLNYIGSSRGIKIGYNFTNYFNQKFTLSFALNLIIECIFIPFLLCVVFPLGFSNIFKRSGTASILSGLTYGVIVAISYNSSFEYALYHALTPAAVIMLLTYLYKTNQNIASVIVTYIMYVLIGVFAINYIL